MFSFLKKYFFFYFQTTQRLEWYADSFAKASRLDFKPEIIHWDQNQIFYSLRSEPVKKSDKNVFDVFYYPIFGLRKVFV